MILIDRSHTFVGGIAGHALRVSYKEIFSCGIGCSRCIHLHTRHERRRLQTCRGRRGRVTSVGSFVRHFECGPAGTMRMRDHVGRLRGVIPVRISRISGDALHLGFPTTLQDNSCPLVYSNIHGTCNGRIIFRSISLAVGHNRGITFINGGNRKGAALIGYVVSRVNCSNDLGIKRGIRVNCFTRGRTRLLSRRLAIFSAVSHITGNSVHLGVHSVLSTFVFNNRTSSGGMGILSKNREDHLTVVGLLLRPIGFLVLSRPAGRLSVQDGSILGRTVHSFSKAIIIIDRSHRFLSNLIAGMCRFNKKRIGRRLNKVCSFLRHGGVRSLGRLRGPILSRSIAGIRRKRGAKGRGHLGCRRRGRHRGGVHGLRGRIRRYRTRIVRLRTTIGLLRTRVLAPRNTTSAALCRQRNTLHGRLTRTRAR